MEAAKESDSGRLRGNLLPSVVDWELDGHLELLLGVDAAAVHTVPLSPEGPSTQYLRTLVPKTIPFMAFGTRILKHWVLGPSEFFSLL